MIKTSELLDQIKEIQCYDFLSAYKVERDPRIKIKLQALLHLRNGKTLREVSEITFYDEKTIKTWLLLFVAFDYEGLIETSQPHILSGHILKNFC